MAETCNGCGAVLEIGSWPFCPDHGRPMASKGFESYVDWNISDKPVLISNPGDRTKYLRPHWENDFLIHVQPRDKSPDHYKDLHARREQRHDEAMRRK